MLNWIILGVAIVTEVGGTAFLKVSDGLTRPLPVIAMAILYAISIAALALALRTIEMSIAYAIWGGLGVALVTIVGIMVFGEAVTLWKLVCIILILLGVVGLNLAHG